MVRVHGRKNNTNIQHALNGGEKGLTIDHKAKKVDGFYKETNTVYEFYGCFWHGCTNCYKPNIVNSKIQEDMGTLCTCQLIPGPWGGREDHWEIDFFEQILSDSHPLGKYCLSNSPALGINKYSKSQQRGT